MGPTEFRLLRHFMEHPGRVFSRGQLLDSVWGQDSDIELRTVDVHIRRLRKAINLPGTTDIIRTVRSAGYALAAGKSICTYAPRIRGTRRSRLRSTRPERTSNSLHAR